MNKRYTLEHIQKLNETISQHFSHLSLIDENMNIAYEGISRMVMLDRYAQKDLSLKTLAIGDLVIAKIKYDAKFPTLGTAFVKSFDFEKVVVQVEPEYINQIDSSYNPTIEGIIEINKSNITKPLEIYYEQIAKRVGYALSAKEIDQKWKEAFYKEIANNNIVPAGRVLYGAGSGTNVTYFNCFVMPMPQDSREGISEHRKNVMEIMSRGGGVGTNGSSLRPKDTIAITVGGKSSGAVSWLNDIAQLTHLVQQGGSRRGAQMIILNDWHPDIIQFIISKMQKASILQWISQNFKDDDIKRYAQDKLQFKPLTIFEKQILEEVVKSSKSEDLLMKSRARLEEGGTYEVTDLEFLTGTNISVGISNDFMEAVKKDNDWHLRFPDIEKLTSIEKDFYNKHWHEIGDVREWEKKGYPVKTYKTIKARELWDLINFCATYSAEPGVFFIDRSNEMTNARAYDQKVVCTNPCGEQPLAPYSVCNLSAINLANMIDHQTSEILWDKLINTIVVAIRMQDNIIDATPYFLEENRIQALGERRIGMGVMGLHDFLIWANIKYGSPESIKLIDQLFEKIATTAYITSAQIAKEKKPFPFQKSLDKLLNTGFIKTLPQYVRDIIVENGGLRNSHLLTIAPTGTTGTMVGVSTGLEPYFAFKYYRSGRLGKFIEVDQKIVAEWKALREWPKDKPLPSFFISAMSLSPIEHADVQTTIQRWIDSSISKTVNAPIGYSVKQVEKIYMRLYDNGAKGGTVYVDGSRNAQVLSIDNDDKKSDIVKPLILITEDAKIKLQQIKNQNADIPGEKQDREIGIKFGNLCPICTEGTITTLGGCNSCTNCGVQLKCEI